MGSLSLHQGIFQTQGSNQGLPHCRRILSQLSHQGRKPLLHVYIITKITYLQHIYRYHNINKHLHYLCIYIYIHMCTSIIYYPSVIHSCLTELARSSNKILYSIVDKGAYFQCFTLQGPLSFRQIGNFLLFLDRLGQAVITNNFHISVAFKEKLTSASQFFSIKGHLWVCSHRFVPD